MYKWIGFLLVFFTLSAQGQELNATVQINYDRVTNANPQTFKTLENALNDFINNTRFTDRNFERNERIQCSFFITLTGYDSGQFSGLLQVQSTRPVLNSTYQSPVFNFNDKDFNFRYNESESLIYSTNSFDSNLVGVISFYANIIIGLDADTFALNGGNDYYQAAQAIATLGQGSGYKGWSQQDGNQNRYFLINDLLSSTYAPFHEALYDYHFKGLDIMSDDQRKGKEEVLAAIKKLSEIYSVRPNAFLTRIFFDAKADEIVSIFSGGPVIATDGFIDTLTRISPLNSSKWSAIK